jgi:FHA domain
VRQSRRDPRDSAAAEQDLYDQLDSALDLCASGQMADLVIQTPQWCQNLIWRPDDPAIACASLAAQGLDDMRLLEEQHGSPAHVVVTALAARLPGLVALLKDALWQPLPEEEEQPAPNSDFGEGLMQDAPAGPVSVTVLEPDAVALAGFSLAERLDQGSLPRGAVEAVPLPTPQGADAGPVRLHYEGHDYPLGPAAFSLGRHPACDLIFASADYPTVSARHCEIVLDRHMFILHDHSRNGTLVNERPVIDEMPLQAGDRIRLGPGGPLLYFLGDPVERKRVASG